MPTVLTFYLLRPGMAARVQHQAHPNGQPSGLPGVTAIVTRDAHLGWCVLADHPDNPGVSVTNGAEQYAQAVCVALGCDVGDLAWYEVDSDGKVDELHLLGASVSFAPLLEDGYPPRSMAALAARAAKLPGGLQPEAKLILEVCLGRVTC